MVIKRQNYIRSVRVKFDDGNEIVTRISGSESAIKRYYAIGKVFNLGTTEDRLARVVSLEFLD